MADTTDILAQLDRRRRELGMSCKVLAERSGVTLRTVQRLLGRESSSANMSTIVVIARALGADVGLTGSREVSAVRKQRAWEKALELTSIAQANAALEGQAVSDRTVERVAEDVVHQLLAGPARRLWEE